jgi:hypothetical protein
LAPQNLRIENGKDQWKIKLIREMIQFDPKQRLPFSEIVKRLADQSNPSFIHATLSGKQISILFLMFPSA